MTSHNFSFGHSGRWMNVYWVAALALMVLAAVLPPGGTFIDDDGNIHEGQIEAIAAEEITLGCASSTSSLTPARGPATLGPPPRVPDTNSIRATFGPMAGLPPMPLDSPSFPD
jgi:hypothetical protein